MCNLIQLSSNFRNDYTDPIYKIHGNIILLKVRLKSRLVDRYSFTLVV